MNNTGMGPVLSCTHEAHNDQQLLDCLARSWNLSVPQLVATLAALVFAHTERAATQHTTGNSTPLPRKCQWCGKDLPASTHHKRRYCPQSDCRQEATNERHRISTPTREQRP